MQQAAMRIGRARPAEVTEDLGEQGKMVDEQSSLALRQVRLDAGKIVPQDEELHDAEPVGVVPQHRAKVLVATQPEPIHIKRLLNTPGEERLLDQQFILDRKS